MITLAEPSMACATGLDGSRRSAAICVADRPASTCGSNRAPARVYQLPKWDRATASGQRSAAQNGQDSSLTNTMAGLPFTVSGGPEEATWCSGVATRPVLTWVSTPSGTAATCRTTAAGAADSLAVRWAGD